KLSGAASDFRHVHGAVNRHAFIAKRAIEDIDRRLKRERIGAARSGTASDDDALTALFPEFCGEFAKRFQVNSGFLYDLGGGIRLERARNCSVVSKIGLAAND